MFDDLNKKNDLSPQPENGANGINKAEQIKSPLSGEQSPTSSLQGDRKTPVEDIFSNSDEIKKPDIFKPKEVRKTGDAFISPPSPGQPTQNREYGQELSGQRKMKKIIIAAIIVIALALVIAGGFWLNSKFLVQTSTPAPNLEGNDFKASDSVQPAEDIPEPEIKEEIIRPLDSDQDGLSDEEEKQYKTSIDNVDTDDDGLFDREEVKVYKTDPLNSDTDGDGYLDGEEAKVGTNPNGAGRLFLLPGGVEPEEKAIDSDGDGLFDSEEEKNKTDILSPDTDNDGLTDYEEVKTYKTDPLNSDTDGDGYLDGDEVNNGYNPKGAGKIN